MPASRSSNPPLAPRLLSRISEARFSLKLRKSTFRLAQNASTAGKEHPIRQATCPSQPQEDVTCGIVTSASLGPVQPISSLTSSLLPLSFAQSRRDIRERKEGFEMSTSSDPIPFALRTQTLLPLDVAYSREDIRRRHEQFEVGGVLDDTYERRQRVLNAQSPRTPPATSTSQPSFQTGESSPSVYSQSRSWIDLSALRNSALLDESMSFESLVAVYSSRSLLAESLAADASSPRRILASASSSSFDEESFMRMAEGLLGW
ncbi:hypothetical protein BV20DRAFT_137903 [Pilatotrama ljubarskyi]|nr:hypothetical protein BV20DRAFT_137903 [Pilatotrama ljubarskyi]